MTSGPACRVALPLEPQAFRPRCTAALSLLWTREATKPVRKHLPRTPIDLQVFVASPGGLKEERDAIDSIAEKLNGTIGDPLNVRLTVRRFENLVGRAGAPQEQINPWVDSCDVFIAVLFRTWGYPTENYDSGFEEEFERAIARWDKTRTPQIALFFKEVDPQSISDPGPQLRRVLDFRAEVEKSRRAFYTSFPSTDALRLHVFQFLVEEMHRAAQTGSEGLTYTPPASGAERTEEAIESTSPDEGDLPAVLHAFSTLTSDGDVSGTLDVDRLELFGRSFSRDDNQLPVHLVNRIYQARAGKSFRVIEANAWLRTWIADIGRTPSRADKAVPFALVSKSVDQLAAHIDDRAGDLLQDESEFVRVGLLRAVRALRRRPPALWPRGPRSARQRLAIHSQWASALGTPRLLQEAALYWISTWRRGDLARARVLQTADDPDVASLGMILVSALSAVADATPAARHSPELLTEQSFCAIFSGADPYLAVETDVLADLLGRYGISDQIRRRSISELLRRDAVTTDILDLVFGDRSGARWSDGWKQTAQALVLDHSPKSASLIEGASEAIGRMKDRAEARKMLARLLNGENGGHIGLDGEISPESLNDDFTSDRAVLAFTVARGGLEFAPTARDLADRTSASANSFLRVLADSLGDEKLARFVEDEMRLGALHYLAGMPAEYMLDADRDRVRSFVGEKNVFRYDALSLLLEVAQDQDVDTLLERWAYLTASGRDDDVVASILERASSKKLHALLSHDAKAVPPRALLEFRRRGEIPSEEELWEMLYSENAELRAVSAEMICESTDRDGARDHLSRYASERPAYFYNVVCEFDRYAAGLPPFQPITEYSRT